MLARAARWPRSTTSRAGPGLSAALGGGVPIGGGAFGLLVREPRLKAAGVTTWTAARISEWPAPHSSVHSTG